jgi:uncharacterized protein YndB with AHSA1/START domain
MSSVFHYVTYIRTTPKKVWDALLKPEFTKRYFFGITLDTDWQVGSPWRMVHRDGSVTDAGEVLEVEPPKRLVLNWRHEDSGRKQDYTRCTFEISKVGGLTKLEVRHESTRKVSQTIEAVSRGWPMILSNLKTMLETGKVLKFSSA